MMKAKLEDLDVFVCYLATDEKHWLAELREDFDRDGVEADFIEVLPGDIARSRRIGVSRGSKDFVCHVDSDDRVLPFVFEKALSILRSDPKIPMVFFGEIYTDVNLKPLSKALPDEVFSLRLMATTPIYSHSIKVYRRDVLEKVIPLISSGLNTPDWEIAARISSYARDNGYKDPVPVQMAGRLYRQRVDSTCRVNKPSGVDNEIMRRILHETYLDRPEVSGN